MQRVKSAPNYIINRVKKLSTPPNQSTNPRAEGSSEYDKLIEKMQPEIIDMARKNGLGLTLVGNIPIHAIHAAHSVFATLPENIRNHFKNSGYSISLVSPLRSNPYNVEDYFLNKYKDKNYTNYIQENHLLNDPAFMDDANSEEISKYYKDLQEKLKHGWFGSGAHIDYNHKNIFKSIPYGNFNSVHGEIFKSLSHEFGHYIDRFLSNKLNTVSNNYLHSDLHYAMLKALQKEGFFSKITDKGIKQGLYSVLDYTPENIAELTSSLLKNIHNNRHFNLSFEKHLENFTNRLSQKMPHTAKIYNLFMNKALNHLH